MPAARGRCLFSLNSGRPFHSLIAMNQRYFSRRQFLGTSAIALAGAACSLRTEAAAPVEPIIDIHQHTDYGGTRTGNWTIVQPGRNQEQLFAHQRAMGVTTTILLPGGRPVLSASTHEGKSNGLESTCTGNE